MPIQLQFDRIPPGRVIGPQRYQVDTILYLAAGALVVERGEDLAQRTVVGAGDVLFEAASDYHLVRNEGTIDALALLASTDVGAQGRDNGSWAWHRGAAAVRRGRSARVAEDGGIIHRLIAKGDDFGASGFAVSEVVIPPGEASEWHRHPGAEHALVVLEGRGSIHVGDITDTIEPLAGIRIVAGVPHRVVASGRTSLRYIVVAMPGLDPTLDRLPAEASEHPLDT